MRKAALDIQTMFDQQNQAVYGKKGVYWGTRQTLTFIHIRIVMQEGYQQQQSLKSNWGFLLEKVSITRSDL